MPTATILIPTHNHVAPLRHSVASVQWQTLQDFELFIVGDGVADATRALVAELSAADPRIRFFDFPKAPRQGDIHRHQALQYAQGRFVAYLGDDDVWMQNHLETLDALLQDADFGHTLHVSIDGQGQIVALPADLENPVFRNRMLTELWNCFDFTFGGHTLAAYRRLPHGWRTPPPEFPVTDLFMWREFLAEPWCRARSAMVPTGICTWTHLRPHLNDEERAAELAYWRAQIALPGFREALWRQIAEQFARQCVHHELDARSKGAEIDRRIARLEAECAASEAQLSALKNSRSWRVTQPLRQMRQLAAGIFGR
jgi:GalNAc5-diNAcBac-PP-undecaprenol beta-1,3-glucosyltransferase